MMERIRQLWAKIQPIRGTGGEVWLDEFELRGAIFSARTSVKLARHQLRKTSKKGAHAKHRVASAKRDLEKDAHHKNQVVEFLETALKRANRLFRSAVGPQEFTSQSQEWRSHLKWIEFHLTYFKPFRASGVSRLQIRRLMLDSLKQMATKGIVEMGYELPEPSNLDSVIRQYLDYSLRGRIGEYNHIFMIRNEDSSVAQLKLFDFVKERLVLKEAS
jgi:hypothetical protein